MAPTGKIAKRRPEALPADFSGWDGGNIPATLPDDFDGFDLNSGSGPVSKPPVQPAKPQVTLRTAVDRQPSAALPNPAKEHAAAPQEPLPPLRSSSKSKSKTKITLVAAVPLVIVLALIPVVYSKLRPKPAIQQLSVVPQSLAPTDSLSSPMKPSPAPPQTTTPTAAERATEVAPPPPPRAQSMDDQLTAPSQIHVNRKASDPLPPSSGLGVAGMEGGGSGVIDKVLSGTSAPAVKVAEAPKTVTISAGVAGGLLVERTKPVYPPLARQSRMSGTVVLQATISKGGSIQSLRVVSGPGLLRQAALDAVKTWRYRPYMLNNTPVEVETTVSVIFTMGG